MRPTNNLRKTDLNGVIRASRPSIKAIKTAARYRWKEILSNLGKLNTQQLSNRAQPCPACGGKDRYRFDDLQGNGTYYCNQCRPGDGLSLLMKVTGWDFSHTTKVLASYLNVSSIEKHAANTPNYSPAKRIEKILQDCISIRDNKATVLHKYLQHRGLNLKILPALNDMHFHLNLPYYEGQQCIGNFPAMVAIIRNQQGKRVSLHRTYLTEDGCKAPVASPKKLLASPYPGATKGGAVRLALPDEGIIAITEGIETAMAVMLLFKIPTWAALSAQGLIQLHIPQGISTVHIMADADHSKTGDKAGLLLAKRLLKENYQVCIHMPPCSDNKSSQDWLDIYNNRSKVI